MEKKEEQDIKEHGEGESSVVNGIVVMENGEVIVETDMDFKPIEHPPEPPEEDLPIKCPIPDALSLIVEEVFEEPSTESLQTIAELLEQKESSTEKLSGTEEIEKSLQTIGELLEQKEPSTEKLSGAEEIEKHQAPLPEHATTWTTPTHKNPHHKFLQVFQQCKELQV